MLNDLLYKGLVAAFGSVVVDNPGVAAEIIPGYANGVPTWHLAKGDEEGEHGEQYRINCPYCRGSDGSRDYKHHLYISYLTFARPSLYGMTLHTGPLYAHCFRCNAMKDPDKREELAFRIKAGIACVQNDGDAVVVAMNSMDLPNTVETPRYETSDKLTVEGVGKWMPGFSLCTDGMDPDIEEYLEGRGITFKMMQDFNIGWGPVKTPRTGKLLKGGVPWVIVPVVMNEKLVGVQARCPDKFIQSKDDLRYYTHPAMRKSAVVYNIDTARRLGLGVVCEGVFDVFKVGSPGVCLFGKEPSMTQKNLLKTIGKGLIWLPDTDYHKDFDTVAEAHSLANDWNAAGVFPLGVHVVVLPQKDAGSMSQNDVWSSILAQLPPDGEMFQYVATTILPRL